MANGNNPPHESPTWIAKAGAAFAGLTLVFFMGLVVAAVLNHDVPTDARFLVLVVLALGAAMSVAFLGGTAAAQGNIPIPGLEQHAIAVSAGGGSATLLIILLLGYYLYVQPSLDSGRDYILTPLPAEIRGDLVIDNDSTDSIVDFGALQTKGKNRYIYVQFRHDGPRAGRIKIRYPKPDQMEIEEATFAVDAKGSFYRQDK